MGPVGCFSPLSRIHAPLTSAATATSTPQCWNGFSPLSRIHAPLTSQSARFSSPAARRFSPLSRIHAPLTHYQCSRRRCVDFMFQSPVEDSCPTDWTARQASVYYLRVTRFSPLSRIHAPLTDWRTDVQSRPASGFSPLSRIHAPLTSQSPASG